MAVDSAAKRYSMIGLGSPVPRLMVPPGGSVGEMARRVLLYLYAGIALDAPAAVLGPFWQSNLFSGKGRVLTLTR